MQSSQFIDENIEKVPGWLLRDAAYLTLYLIDIQSRITTGSLMEIGVYGGKYLSILYQGSRSDPSAKIVLGIDIYTDISEDDVTANIIAACGDSSRLRLLKADSTTLKAETLLDQFTGARPRFVSIDGSHISEHVCSDLCLAESIIGDCGIIALDDFLNPLAIGVSAGFYKFFMNSKETLVPLAYGSNKLYLCTKASKGYYEDAIFRFVMDYEFLPTAQDFTSRQLRGRQWIEQKIFANKLLIL
jgi:hypothetical protein